jgi:hypothetical protein
VSDFGFPFPVSCIGVLGLLSHEEEGFGLPSPRETLSLRWLGSPL